MLVVSHCYSNCVRGIKSSRNVLQHLK